MTAKECLNKVTNDINRPGVYRQHVKDYIMSHCAHPRPMWIYDSHLGKKRLLRVPCGTCYHCVESRKNEWCTRMYSHANTFKNCYFVTLTYKSLHLDRADDRFLIDYLQDAFYVLDNHNQTKNEAWSPCVLVKSHYQNFIKRLRKQTNDDSLSYAICGEYGKSFGRPHWHLILFTNNTLTLSDIYKAWSLYAFYDGKSFRQYKGNKVDKNLRQFKKRLLFGKVDFNDLKVNGSFNELHKVRVDNHSLNVSNCFKYVCKYIQKRDYNDVRVLAAFRNIYYKNNAQEAWLYRSSMLHQIHHIKRSNAFIHFTFDTEDIMQAPALQEFSNIIYLKNFKFYEKTDDGRVVFALPFKVEEFLERFRPIFRVSTGKAIGRLYAETHISEFRDGVFAKPQLQDSSSFVVPKYWRTMAESSIYSLRKCSELSSSPSFGISCLPMLLQDFNQLSKGGCSFLIHLLPGDFAQTFSAFDYSLNSLMSSRYAWRDGRIRFVFVDSKPRITVYGFVYSRESRSYSNVSFCYLDDFIAEYRPRILSAIERHNLSVQICESNYKYYDDLVELLDLPDSPFYELRDSLESEINCYHLEKQTYYNLDHYDPC